MQSMAAIADRPLGIGNGGADRLNRPRASRRQCRPVPLRRAHHGATDGTGQTTDG
jgi:hypothetical protein